MGFENILGSAPRGRTNLFILFYFIYKNGAIVEGSTPIPHWYENGRGQREEQQQHCHSTTNRALIFHAVVRTPTQRQRRAFNERDDHRCWGRDRESGTHVRQVDQIRHKQKSFFFFNLFFRFPVFIFSPLQKRCPPLLLWYLRRSDASSHPPFFLF